MNQALQDSWLLQPVTEVPEAVRGSFHATVPGCVHTDLLAAGVIEDPYWGENESETDWIGRADWKYSRTFLVSAEMLTAEHFTLVCDGLDTVAEIYVNGELVAQTESMHVGYRFELTPFVIEGENELSIIFRSPYNYAEAQKERLGELPNAYPEPYNFIRKMACNFGWDWGPTLVTSGIWRDIYLETWSGARINAVRPLILTATEAQAKLALFVEVEGAAESHILNIQLTSPKGVVTEKAVSVGPERLAKLVLDVDDPDLWWPRGYGAQPLYSLVVSIGDSVWQGRVGLRTVEMDTAPDDIGAAFTLKVNDTPVFCKGANWIPNDCFPHRVTPERYRERITQAVDANMNMLRVWGGGIYEQEAFFDVCDELGVMVWQDFLFACAAYPEEAPFTQLVEAEARYQVARLAPHPSLVLWNGNNENLEGYADWGWQEKLVGRTWGRGFYLDLLPKIIAELDPSRPYWPGSPWSGDETLPPNLDTHGPKHTWDVWNQRDYTHYRDHKPRFAAEFGFQAPPTFATLQESIPTSDFYATSPAMLHHQKATSGNDKLMKGLANHFGNSVLGKKEDFDDWLFLTQLNQARALTLGVEWYRSLQPRCMGTLFWQLNDCWPVTSWSAIDGSGRKKSLWYATRRFFADRLLTFQPSDSGLSLFACNDTDATWSEKICVRRLDFAGKVMAEGYASFHLHARTTASVLELPESLNIPDNPTGELLIAQGTQTRAIWFFVRDQDLHYPEPDFDATLETVGSGYTLTLKAHTLLRDFTLFVDRLDADAKVNDALVTLLPGEAFTFEIQSSEELTLDALLGIPVFKCANRFGAPTVATIPTRAIPLSRQQ